MEGEIEMVKILINSILTANHSALSIGQLESEYRQVEKEYIPFKKFGYSSLLEFLAACSDKIRIVHSEGAAMVLPVVAKETKHIHELVQNQKKNPSKQVSFRINRDVEQKILRLLLASPDRRVPLNNLSSIYQKTYWSLLPSPKGKLVAWLSTSDQFAIITIEKDVKVIEPLSNIDTSRCHLKTQKASDSKPREPGRTALGNMLSVSDRLPKASRAARQSSNGVSPSARADNKSAQPKSPRAISTTPSEPSAACVKPAKFEAADFVHPPTRSAQPEASPASFSFAASTSTNKAQCANATTDSATRASTPPTLTPEIRGLLLGFMMKSPDNMSVRALSREYNSVKGPVPSPTLIGWLTSMEECLLIGGDNGRVFLRPQYRKSKTALDTQAQCPSNVFATRAAAPDSRPDCPPRAPNSGPTSLPWRANAFREHESASTQQKPALNLSSLKKTIQVTVRSNQDATQRGLRGSCDQPTTTHVTTDGSVDTNPAGAFRSVATVATVPAFPPATRPCNGSKSSQWWPGSSSGEAEDRVLQGKCGLVVTDLIDLVKMMWRKPKVPLDQLGSEFQEMFQRRIEPQDGPEALVDYLCTLGVLKVAPNSDVSLYSPVELKSFTYTGISWIDMTHDGAFWNSFMKDDLLAEGVCMTGKVVAYNDVGYTFVPNWSPPQSMYTRANVVAQGRYTYICGEQKLRAVAQSKISEVGHWVVYLSDLKRFKPCRDQQLFVGPPQPAIHVIPIGRCPAVGSEVKLKVVHYSCSVAFACIDHEEVCGTVTSSADPNFSFRLLHWDNQGFIPREDLTRLAMDKGLTAMDPTAITAGDYFINGFWMADIQDQLFIPASEFVELLDTLGFREDVIHDLLLL